MIRSVVWPPSFATFFFIIFSNVFSVCLSISDRHFISETPGSRFVFMLTDGGVMKYLSSKVDPQSSQSLVVFGPSALGLQVPYLLTIAHGLRRFRVNSSDAIDIGAIATRLPNLGSLMNCTSSGITKRGCAPDRAP